MEKKSTDAITSTFGVPSFDGWIRVASAETGGEPPLEKLTWKLSDLEFLPIYTSANLNGIHPAPPFVLGNESRPRSWANVPSVVVDNEQSANATALDHLENEAEGVLFQLQSGQTDFRKLLNNISWEHCTVSFSASTFSPELYDIMEQRYDARKLSGVFFQTKHDDTVLKRTGIKMLGVIVAPSNAVDEIAEGLLQGTRLIEKFADKGHNIEEPVRHIAFQLPIGTELLADVSKLKAMRRVWHQAVRAYGIKDYYAEDLYLHGYSDKWINPKYQPHGNLLKGTVASIAAVAGGCNALTVVPEDPQNTMMSRIARNASHILLEEAQLGKVNDPFAGAYALEVMTDKIAAAAWKKFQSLL